MADDMDLASARSEEFLADSLAAVQRQLSTGPSRTHCEDCEEEIPAARRKARPGCTRCVDCQTTHENWRPL